VRLVVGLCVGAAVGFVAACWLCSGGGAEHVGEVVPLRREGDTPNFRELLDEVRRSKVRAEASRWN
jgi:hypothetical protein